MSAKAALILPLLLTATLAAEVDLTRLPPAWAPSKPPEALLTGLPPGVENKDYLVLIESNATLIYNSSKIAEPYFGKGYEPAVKGILSGFAKSAAAAKTPLIKNELVKKDGVEILHQEVIQAGQCSIVLSQIEPAKIDQIMLIFPEGSKDHDAIVAAGYSAFRPVADAAASEVPRTPAGSTTTVAANPGLDVEAVGRLSFYVVFAIGILLFIVFVIRKQGGQKPPGGPPP